MVMSGIWRECTLIVLVLHTWCSGYNFGPEDVIINQLLHDDIVKIDSLRSELERQGKIVKTKRDLLLISLKNGIKGVFKQLNKNAICAEVAAYKASHILGFDLVPPTVIRTINGTRGSLQLFVKTNVDPMVRGAFDDAVRHADPDELATLKIFYYVFGQWSNGPRNILINSENGQVHFIAIDNEGLWHRKYWRYGDNAFIYRHWEGINIPKTNVESFPYDNYFTITNPTPAVIIKKLGPIVPKNYIHWFCELDPLNYAYYNDSLWVQLKGDAPCFAYSHHFPEDTIAKLKQIDQAMLYEIFSDAKAADFVTDEFLDSILDRRDQVLAKYKQTQGN